MKKNMTIISIGIVSVLLASIVGLVGCSGLNTSKSFTFNVSTGDVIEVELDTTEGLDITADGGSFIVSKDDNQITQGIFLEPATYFEYEEAARIMDNFKHNKVRGHNGFYYESNEEGMTEYIYMIRLNDSNTAVAMSTISSESDATEVASHVIFTVGE